MIAVILSALSFLYAENLTFNGIPLGAKKDSFTEITEFSIGELNFKKILYTYEDDFLTVVTANISGKKNSMFRLTELLSILKKKYNAETDIYTYASGDIIQMLTPENDMISIVLAEVENEDCDAKLEEGKIIFISNKRSLNKDLTNF